MSHLIEQLLTLSKLDETSSLAGAETLNLAGLVQECCAEVGMSALEKNIEIELAAETEPVMAGSADVLHIMLRNLLDNAIRYSPEGGRVLVTLSTASDGRADLEIADNGAGVSDESLAQLGERFNRLGQSGESGVGLGLSIVRRIAEIHHAGVAFSRSAALGGLSVKVSFPPQRAG